MKLSILVKFYRVILFLLISISSIGQSLSEENDFYYALHSVDFAQNKNLEINRIRSSIQYFYHDTNSKLRTIKSDKYCYDIKGRLIKIRHFSNKDDSIPYFVKFCWINDTIIDLKIVYRNDFKWGKQIKKYDDNGAWLKTYFLRFKKLGKKYSIRAQISLNSNSQITQLSGYDINEERFQINFTQGPIKYFRFLNYDTVYENGKIAAISCVESWNNEYDGKLDRNIGPFTVNMSIWNFDTNGRVEKIIHRNDIMIYDNKSYTTIKYNAFGQIETQEDIGITNNFKGNKYNYVYDNDGKLLKESFDRAEYDSLIDRLKFYQNDTIIKRDKHIIRRDKNEFYVQTWETMLVKGMVRLEKVYYNEGPAKHGYLYRYKKRFMNF